MTQDQIRLLGFHIVRESEPRGTTVPILQIQAPAFGGVVNRYRNYLFQVSQLRLYPPYGFLLLYVV